MFGCCGQESLKFRNQDGKIDVKRWNEVKEILQDAKLTPEMIEYVEACTCSCHKEGLVVMC